MKILVTRRLPSSVISKLSAAPDVDLYTRDAAIPHDELCARVADKDALVCVLPDRVDRAVIDAAPGLQALANVRVGYNNIDLDSAQARLAARAHEREVL